MKTRRTLTNCKNHRVEGRCDDWVKTLPPLPQQPLSGTSDPPEFNLKDLEKADKICARCNYFESKS